MKLTIIGDVHGKLERYKEIIDKCEFSICVGDFGFKEEWDEIESYLEQPKFRILSMYAGHYINMGNHDFIPYSQCYPSLNDWTWMKENSIFTIRGAKSIDSYLREEGKDWFANEELNYKESLKAFDFYSKVKPKIVISHDCPSSIAESFFGITDKNGTRQTLQAMFDEHQPEFWFFGHHHKSKDEVINGTRFICLAELETFEIEL